MTEKDAKGGGLGAGAEKAGNEAEKDTKRRLKVMRLLFSAVLGSSKGIGTVTYYCLLSTYCGVGNTIRAIYE